MSTVSRGAGPGGGRAGCSAWRAQERAREQARGPKAFKPAAGRLLAEAAKRAEQLWPPQEVVARLRLEHPGGPEMHGSHEAVCRSLFVQGWGGLRRELARCLNPDEPHIAGNGRGPRTDSRHDDGR